MVNNVLNTLAGKLYYDAYKKNEKNLNGKVQIASGLTSSSAALKVGDITFNETTGQGSYVFAKSTSKYRSSNRSRIYNIYHWRS